MTHAGNKMSAAGKWGFHNSLQLEHIWGCMYIYIYPATSPSMKVTTIMATLVGPWNMVQPLFEARPGCKCLHVYIVRKTWFYNNVFIIFYLVFTRVGQDIIGFLEALGTVCFHDTLRLDMRLWENGHVHMFLTTWLSMEDLGKSIRFHQIPSAMFKLRYKSWLVWKIMEVGFLDVSWRTHRHVAPKLAPKLWQGTSSTNKRSTPIHRNSPCSTSWLTGYTATLIKNNDVVTCPMNLACMFIVVFWDKSLVTKKITAMNEADWISWWPTLKKSKKQTSHSLQNIPSSQ